MSIAIDESGVIQYNESQAARLLGLSKKTLQKFRLTGEGPRYIRVSARCIRYRLVDLRAWQESKLVSSTSEPCPGASNEMQFFLTGHVTDDVIAGKENAHPGEAVGTQAGGEIVN